MKGDMVEKRRILVDGEELEGLVNIEEPTVEKGVVNVPGADRLTPVSNNVRTIPQVPAVFKLTRNSRTLKVLQDWFEKSQYKDCVIIRTDGSGAEIARELWPNTEISKFNGPGYNAESPAFAQQLVTFLPENIIPIDAEA